MKLPPLLHSMPRVKGDIKRCLDFVGRQPWGKPSDRELDISQSIEEVLANPEANRPELRRPDTGIWLRRCNAAQFVVVYTYLPSGDPDLPGVVSIRAVRHRRVENVFAGVKEPLVEYAACGNQSAQPGDNVVISGEFMTSETENDPGTVPSGVAHPSGSHDSKSEGQPEGQNPSSVVTRLSDDNSDDIDWEDIILTTHEDFEAGRFAFNSKDYATRAEADVALTTWLDTAIGAVDYEPPNLHMMPRVERDIRECMARDAQEYWPNPRDRRTNIRRAIAAAVDRPEGPPIEIYSKKSGIWLRRRQQGPFVVVYAYLYPSRAFPYGAVSIRAVLYSRVDDFAVDIEHPSAYSPSHAR